MDSCLARASFMRARFADGSDGGIACNPDILPIEEKDKWVAVRRIYSGKSSRHPCRYLLSFMEPCLRSVIWIYNNFILSFIL